MKLKAHSQTPLASELESRAAAGDARGSAADLTSFARLLLAGHARDAEQLLGDTALADLVTQAFAVVSMRRDAGAKIEVRSVADARDPARRFTSVHLLNDDMPFIVDSIMAEINARGLSAHLVLHPILHVRRSPSGSLEALARGDGSRQESFMLVLLDPLDEEAGAALVNGLREVLTQVHAAVIDWRAMIARLDQAIGALETNPASTPDDLNRETVAFCRWLRNGEFTFLGMRDYRLAGDPQSADLEVIEGSGLGLLRDPNARVLRQGSEPVHMTPEVRRFFFAPQPIIITKSNTVSRVHRRVHMDYIGLKTYAEDGTLTGELRVVGLFTSKAYTEPPQKIPFLRLKVETVVREAGYPPESHDGKALLHVLETFPRDELFQIGVRQLQDWAAQILKLDLRPRTLVLARSDRFGRFVSLLVHLPRDRYSTSVRERVGQVLANAYQGRVSAYNPSFTSGPLVRVHFIIARTGGRTPPIPQAELEALVNNAIRTWDDELAEALSHSPDAALLLPRYRNAFTAGYSETFSVARALEDIGRIERLGPERPVAIDFYDEPGSGPSVARAAVYRFAHPIPLSERVPVLENLGFQVIDERSYRVHPKPDGGQAQVALHDMVLEEANGIPIDLKADGRRLEECFLAVFRGDADNDPFNRLVMAAGADWRDVTMVRAYAAYLRQIRSPFGARYIAETLERHGGLSRDLIDLFHIRFDPIYGEAVRGEREADLRERFESALERVASLDEDRILRQMLNVITATVRTNFFRLGWEPGVAPLISFKIASAEVAGLPAPRPFREIWVFSPRLEGIHLRFAPIARGGLRWSDRQQDFRTEVLGLAKAQQVKNAVIVPAGAKGGFVPKHLPVRGSREEIQKEGTAAYHLFVSSLLDVTDNLIDGEIVPPDRVVRHDGDDPYLVVAADKGTATFSDLANGISAEHDFWLGDAFASGGSAGYDHKKMGITARGAWECVKRHFREMDCDIQTEPFSVAGVGDMSGDVFGNGMLLSEHTRLIAAFDHRDIFLDPDPDPATAFAERRRMFQRPRSSWQDYDKTRISTGGGVFPRSAKSIPLSDEVRMALGITASALTPADLIRAILCAPVDLLWFGGIGTYVRASTETDEQVGDRANDPVRIAAGELRAQVVGEGANLAMTQKARIEFARQGGRLNTDFIDNSAGVNSSDQEVNIKIALQPAVRSGRLTLEARNDLLTEMTDDVARACLRNNYQQSLALSLAQQAGAREFDSLAVLMQRLEAHGLERRLDALPDDAELLARKTNGLGMVRPELSVLLSSAKIELYHALLETEVPALEDLRDILLGYFPSAMRKRLEADILAHPLRREIVATDITNEIVNRCGPAFAADLQELTGRGTAEIALAFIAATRSFDLPRVWSEIDQLDNKLQSRVQLALYGTAQAALRARVFWLTRTGITADGLAGTIAVHRYVWSKLSAAMPDVLTPSRVQAWTASVSAYGADGVPPALARTLASLDALAEGIDIAALVDDTGHDDPAVIAKAFFEVSDQLGLSTLRAAVRMLDLSDRFDRMAVEDAISSIAAGQRKLTGEVLAERTGGDAFDIEAWLAARGSAAVEARHRLAEISTKGELTVSRLTVAAKLVRELAGH